MYIHVFVCTYNYVGVWIYYTMLFGYMYVNRYMYINVGVW